MNKLKDKNDKKIYQKVVKIELNGFAKSKDVKNGNGRLLEIVY